MVVVVLLVLLLVLLLLVLLVLLLVLLLLVLLVLAVLLLLCPLLTSGAPPGIGAACALELIYLPLAWRVRSKFGWAMYRVVRRVGLLLVVLLLVVLLVLVLVLVAAVLLVPVLTPRRSQVGANPILTDMFRDYHTFRYILLLKSENI